MFVWLLIGCSFILMLVRIGVPFGIKSEGRVVATVTLTYREKLLLHRTNLYALGALLVLSAIGKWFPTTVGLVILLAALALVNLPVRYQFTTLGIACNNVLFRKWKEFEYARYRGAKLTLVQRNCFSSLPLFVLASRQDEVFPYFRRFLQVRNEAPPKFLERPLMLWLRRRLSLIALMALFGMSLLFLLSACGEGPDPSGLNTAKQSNLTGVSANGTPMTQQQLDAAKSKEPFAYNLALLVDENRLGINFVWTLVTGYLVMFMQAGFALVETGLCRAKNAGHTMAMNFMIYGLGMIGYFIFGFAFQFGGIGLVGVPNLGGLASLKSELAIPIGGVNWGIIGYKGFFLSDGTYDVGVAVMFLFQMVFMDTTAAIPTGAMAERWKWSAFCVYGLFVSTLVYPVFGNWAWGGGWLSQLGAIGLGKGYIDFAGSGVVHAVGGWCGLAGAMVLGSRLGKYNRDGSANTIPGHNLVFGLLGCFILAFGWFGFNPGSTLGASGNGNLRIGSVAVNTMLAGMAGGFGSMFYMWLRYGKPDASMSGNGLLAGLVAITAPSGFVNPVGAVIIGLIAGVLVCLSVEFVDRVLKVDDPVGAISVHGTNGLWGVISVGLFADGKSNYGGSWNGVSGSVTGLFYGDSSQLLAQLIGVSALIGVMFTLYFLMFKLVDMVLGQRVSAEAELEGLDIPEMGALCY